MMYLTRIKLDLHKRKTVMALINPNIFHGVLQNAMKDGEDFSSERYLWRMEEYRNDRYLLILSARIPNLRLIETQLGFTGQAEVKDYTSFLNTLKKGEVFRFRLLANPTFYQVIDGKEMKLAQKVRSKQIEWIEQKGETGGFEILDVIVRKTNWVRINKNNNQKRMVSFLAVQYEGVLKITNLDLFLQSLLQGIGREKAYGMGMLSIARVNGHA